MVIPGIMGSELRDRDLGREIWAVPRAAGYAVRWRDRELMAALAVTDEERAGKTGRVEVAGLIGVPHLGAVFGGLEPYGPLVRDLRRVAHPAAVREFAYDWRLSVAYNATLLAEAMHRFLGEWQATDDHERARRMHPDGSPARLVLVAHSMGGLLIQSLAAVPGALDEVRLVITLGTPFHGSVLALQLLATGTGAPLPLAPARLRQAARTMPGVHDLLPGYRCVREGDDVRALHPADIAMLGGDAELAGEALTAAAGRVSLPLPGHRAVVGIGQATPTSVTLDAGTVTLHPFGYRRHGDDELMRNEHTGELLRVDYGGDATVFTEAASPVGAETTAFAQQHGALPAAATIRDLVTHLVATGGRNRGTGLGVGRPRLEAPAVAVRGEPLSIEVSEQDPARDRIDSTRVSCVIEDPGQADRVLHTVYLDPTPGDPRRLSGRVTLARPGLYRIAASIGGDPVTRLLLVQEPGEAAEAELLD
ncbi:esterase/lipase family protein [Actinoplanes sp. CA-252034]|uniref:esterase/lipase family protein n=1 Tax=Actinoplanes sp. CA-252034 TaxID=3239906 RepID=UPI003D9662A0